MNILLKQKLDRLEKLKSSIIREILSMPEDKANIQPEKGKWSAVQVGMHLYTAELNGLKYMQKKIQAADKLAPSGIMGKLRTLLLRLALRINIKYKAPEIVSNPSNRITPKELKEKWTALRMELVSFLNEIPEKYHDKAIFKHPMAGKINLFQALDFMGDHMQRHLKQVNRIKNSLKD